MSKLIANVYCDRSGTFDGLKGAIEEAIHAGAQSLFILGCETNHLDLDQVNAYLPLIEIPVFGGVFPQIVANDGVLHQGHFVCALNAVLPMMCVPLAFGSESGWPVLRQYCHWLAGAHSSLVLFDGRADQIEPFVKHLRRHIDSNKLVIGAAAGMKALSRQPCLFSNQGMLSNAALLMALPGALTTATHHAWHAMAGPLLVTYSEANIIHTLNYQPAYDVYRNIVGAYIDQPFKDHPFGIEKLNAEMLIRNIVDVKEDALVLSAEVSEQSMLYVMKTQPGALVDVIQADLATSRALKESETSDRLLFLEARYEDELADIAGVLQGGSTLIGAMTLGGLANSQWSGVQFLNQALVLGALQGKRTTTSDSP